MSQTKCREFIAVLTKYYFNRLIDILEDDQKDIFIFFIGQIFVTNLVVFLVPSFWLIFEKEKD